MTFTRTNLHLSTRYIIIINFEHTTCVPKFHVPLYRLHKTFLHGYFILNKIISEFWELVLEIRQRQVFPSTFRHCTCCSSLCSGYRNNSFHVVEMFWINLRPRLFTEYVERLEESCLTKTVLGKYLQRRRDDGKCVKILTFNVARASLCRLISFSGARAVCQKSLTPEDDEGDDLYHWHGVKGSQHHSEQFPPMSLSQVPV